MADVRGMASIELLNIQPLSDGDRARIEAVDPSVTLTDAQGWFNGEIIATWPAYTTRRYVAAKATGKGSRGERDALLANAEIILGGWPYPLDIRARAAKLKWYHQRPAGANNLWRGDLWQSDVVVTTSRGHGATLPIAEYVLAGMFHFAKGFNQAVKDSANRAFEHQAYAPLLLAGKTMCVIGVGGIGREVGRLCAALGMKVVGTRGRAPEEGPESPEGFADIRGPDGLFELLADADFVAVCCQLTAATEGLLGRAAFRAMKPGAILVNVARGEIIDHVALLCALDQGDLRGAALDVYTGEFEGPPGDRLWRHPRVLITPHTSNGGDGYRARSIDIFCANLAAYLAGGEMKNVIDWRRGY